MDSLSRLNPDIKEFEFGKKELHTVTVYPLAMGDQFKVSDMIVEIAQSVIAANIQGTVSDAIIVKTAIEAIRKNISDILMLITEQTAAEVEDMISEITNNQLTALVEIVWSVNYEESLKNGRSLFERMKQAFQSKRSSQDS